MNFVLRRILQKITSKTVNVVTRPTVSRIGSQAFQMVVTLIIGILKRAATIAVETYRQFRVSDVQILAGNLAFVTVISLVPLLAVSLSVFSAYGGFDSLLKKIEPFILQNLVEASGAELSKAIRRSVHRVHSGALGAAGVVGLFLASTKLFNDMETAVQRVWRIRTRRPIALRLLLYWLIMFLGPLVLAFTLGVLGSRDLGLVQILPQSALAVALAFLTLVVIYKFVPARIVSWQAAFTGAVFASTGIALAQAFYAEITRNVLRYNKIYGSLASFPIFLIWLLVLWWIFLVGVALSAVIQNRRDQNS
jgi:membrane protein